MVRRVTAAVLFALAAFALLGVLLAAPFFPALTGRVVDLAGLLTADQEARLTHKLSDLESQTGSQLVIVTLRSLDGHDISDYGYQLGRKWGIGQKAKNNGVLLIVAPKERRVRIEIGYGLEGLLTDAVTRLIIDNAILPRFRANDFAGGIERGTDDIIQVLSGDAAEFQRRAAERTGRPSTQEGGSSFIIVLLILGFWFLMFLRRSRQHRRVAARRRSGLWFPPILWGGGSRGGGGWSGGGSGGFSGRGGSFGGGGSSGSW
jgi:uncharacterized protein